MTMRITLLVLSTLAIVAACSQDGSTSPASHRSSPTTRASLDAAPISDSPPGPANGSKPAAAFTSITEVSSELVSWDGVNKVYGAGVATCPPGSIVTGGGYVLNGGADVIVMYNSSFGPNAWRIYAYSHSAASFTVYARCIQ
jgi:hypothetical protein